MTPFTTFNTTYAESTTVTFDDPAFEAYIRKQLHKPEGSISGEDMQSLTELASASWLGIRSLKGIEFATNLTRLSIEQNKIADLSPLAGLVKLKRITLDYNEITDLSPLSNLTEVTDLILYDNKIKSLEPLKT